MPESETDALAETPTTTSEWAEVRNSTVHGSGMFATREIPVGTSIIEYIGIELTKGESDRRGTAHQAKAAKTGEGAVFLFIKNDEYDIDGNVPYNTARLINHSCDPNCEAQIDDDDRIWIVSIGEIKEGEELTFNYGFDLEDFEEHPCRCGSKKCAGFIVDEQYWPELKKILKRKKEKRKKGKGKKGKGKKGKGKKGKGKKGRKKRKEGKKKRKEGKKGKKK